MARSPPVLRQQQEFKHCCYGKGVEDHLGLGAGSSRSTPSVPW
jgi:hypothetical protein